MITLAQTLATTTPVSVLLRKARRLGFHGIGSMIDLAVARGCRHYEFGLKPLENPPSRSELTDEELTVLLLIGENAYDPIAIRCAAQIARSPHVDPVRLCRIAIMEKTERVLAHIARAGIDHDPEGVAFWQSILSQLPDVSLRQEPDLPHWSRFVATPGRQRRGVMASRWLVPTP